MRTLELSTTMLRRGLRTRELRLLLAALVLAAAATSSILIATDRMDRAMVSRAADLMGADLAVHSSREVAQAYQARAAELGLRHTRVLEFASMVSAGQGFQLAAVKAVAKGFPLRGELRTGLEPRGQGEVTDAGPARGEVWLENRLFAALDIKVGDTLSVGRASFRVSRALLYEPGRAGDFYSLAPRVLMHLDDVQATGVIQPGSRLSWRYLFAGSALQIKEFAQWLRPQLQSSEHMHDPRDPDSGSGRALRNTERFLGLAVLAAVVLAGVAIAVSASLYARKQIDCVALMRCFGASGAQAQRLYWLQFLMLGVGASMLGSLLGLGLHEVLLWLLSGLLPTSLPPVALTGLLPGLLLGPLLLAGFSMPVLAGLGRVPVLRILRNDLPAQRLPLLFTLAPALLVTGLIAGWFVGELRLTLLAIGGFALLALALLVLGWMLVRVLGIGGGPAVLRRLTRRPLANLGLLAGLALSVMAMSVVAILRFDLLSTWASQLPDRAPNQFAVNVFADEIRPMSDFLEAGGVSVEPFYPIVRGRLVSIDGESVRELVSKEERTDRALNRELNLTWAQQLPYTNELESGRWFEGDAPEVSVESLLAGRLDIELGQKLGFTIGSEQLEVTVTSIRKVDWNSFRPNFYMIFPPGFLEQFPATYITSFYLPAEKSALLNELNKAFPSVTLLDMAQIISQVRSLMDQVSVAIEFILSYVLVAGLLVLASAVAASLPARRQEAAIARALGATRRRIRGQLLEEFALLGLLAGICGLLGAELLMFLLYRELLELPWSPQFAFWLTVPPACALLVATAGWLGARETVTTPPVQVLRAL